METIPDRIFRSREKIAPLHLLTESKRPTIQGTCIYKPETRQQGNKETVCFRTGMCSFIVGETGNQPSPIDQRMTLQKDRTKSKWTHGGRKGNKKKITGVLALQVEGSHRQGKTACRRPLEDGKESLSYGDAFRMSRVEIGLLRVSSPSTDEAMQSSVPEQGDLHRKGITFSSQELSQTPQKINSRP